MLSVDYHTMIFILGRTLLKHHASSPIYYSVQCHFAKLSRSDPRPEREAERVWAEIFFLGDNIRLWMDEGVMEITWPFRGYLPPDMIEDPSLNCTGRNARVDRDPLP